LSILTTVKQDHKARPGLRLTASRAGDRLASPNARHGGERRHLALLASS